MKGILKIESLHTSSERCEGSAGTLSLWKKGKRNAHLVIDFEEFTVIELPGMRGNGKNKYAFRAGCHVGFEEAVIYDDRRIEIKLPVLTNGAEDRYQRGMITFKEEEESKINGEEALLNFIFK